MMKGCPKCGRMVTKEEDICPYCGYKFAEIEKVYKTVLNDEQKKIPENPGLIQRLMAFYIDVLLMTLIYFIFYTLNPLNGYVDFLNINIVYVLIVFIIYFFYTVILEGSPLKGTIGLRLLNLQVVDEGGYQIGFAMAFKHNFFKFLNVLTLGIGYLALMFTKHKQTIADYFSDVYVENRSLEYNNKLFYANIFLRVLAFIIDMFILSLIYFGMTFIMNYLIVNEVFSNLKEPKLLVYSLISLIGMIYFTVLDSQGKTIGKRLFNFEVTNLNGESIGLIRSFFRTLFMIFELVLMPFAVLLVFTKPTKQTFKDLITKTVVIKKVYYK